MSVDLRLPLLTGTTPAERLIQLHGYLNQLIPQLQFALNDLDKKQETIVRAQTQTRTGTGALSEQQAISTFHSIKALIIKSADIVESYTEEISRTLSGLYVAKSEFGDYTEQTQARLTETSRLLEAHFSALQTIEGEVARLEASQLATSAYIKSGLLYYGEDGFPVYGIELGQTNEADGGQVFDKFARFTPDRLSFYDTNGTEVAYISDYQITITNVHISGWLRLGSYRIDTTDGLAFLPVE